MPDMLIQTASLAGAHDSESLAKANSNASYLPDFLAQTAQIAEYFNPSVDVMASTTQMFVQSASSTEGQAVNQVDIDIDADLEAHSELTAEALNEIKLSCG